MMIDSRACSKPNPHPPLKSALDCFTLMQASVAHCKANMLRSSRDAAIGKMLPAWYSSGTAFFLDKHARAVVCGGMAAGMVVLTDVRNTQETCPVRARFASGRHKQVQMCQPLCLHANAAVLVVSTSLSHVLCVKYWRTIGVSLGHTVLIPVSALICFSFGGAGQLQILM